MEIKWNTERVRKENKYSHLCRQLDYLQMNIAIRRRRRRKNRNQDFLLMEGSVCSNSACRAAADQRKKSRWSRSRRCLACGAASRGDSFIKPSTSCLKCSKSPQRWPFDPQFVFLFFLDLFMPESSWNAPKRFSSSDQTAAGIHHGETETGSEGHFTASWPRQASHFHGWLECILEKKSKIKKSHDGMLSEERPVGVVVSFKTRARWDVKLQPADSGAFPVNSSLSRRSRRRHRR